MKRISSVVLAALGVAGQHLKIEYSGWVLFIALLAFLCAQE